MDCNQLAKTKAGLLCYGINVDDAVGKELAAARPYFYDKGFVHAVNTNVCGSNVCVSVAEKFSKASPYTLRKSDGGFYVEWDGGSVPIRLFDDLPPTGTVIDMLARPHSDSCISLWPSLVCCFDRPGAKCKFCSIKPTDAQQIVPPEQVVEGLRALHAKTGDRYSVNIGGGTVKNPDEMVRYLSQIIRGYRQFSSNAVSVELAPPSRTQLLQELFDAGASSLIMNLEIADNELRRDICPGKAHITYEHYYDCYREGVRIFGRGKISCVLIVGIQPPEDIVSECAKLTDEGVIPTLIPFKPMDDCELRDRPNCDADELIYVSTQLGKMLQGKGLSPKMQEGCTKCGGCSLETNYYGLTQ